MRRSFVKYSGCGNDFILIDNRDASFPEGGSAIAKQLCQRKMGIGADGLLLVETSNLANVRMSIFNADGSEAEMCGNGLRCVAAWLFQSQIKPSTPFYSVLVGEIVYLAEKKNGEICIRMPKPKSPPLVKELEWKGHTYKCHWIDSGVPHAVTIVEELEELPLEEIGPFVRFHPYWGPRGANATFTKKLRASEWKMRTFERGVEAETLACGTGGMAVAYLADFLLPEPVPICVEMASSEKLFFFRCDDFYWMQGPARLVFEGTVDL